MLLLNLTRIRTAHDRFDHVYAPETFADDRETFTVVEPVRLGFDVHKDQDVFRLAGRVQTSLEMPCGRCLEPFTIPVDAAFDLRYQPRAAAVAGAAMDVHEVHDDDFAAAFYDNDEIDLGQLMQEQFYLAVPMKPLCREDCRGLCAQCGTNLNRGTCTCAHDWEDPRFAALKALREQPQREH